MAEQINKDVSVVLKAQDHMSDKLKRAESQLAKTTREVERLRASADKAGKSATALNEFARHGAMLTKTINTVAALRIGIDAARVATDLFSGDMEKAVSTLERLPMGIGEIVRSLKELLGELAGVNKELDSLKRAEERGRMMGESRASHVAKLRELSLVGEKDPVVLAREKARSMEESAVNPADVTALTKMREQRDTLESERSAAIDKALTTPRFREDQPTSDRARLMAAREAEAARVGREFDVTEQGRELAALRQNVEALQQRMREAKTAAGVAGNRVVEEARSAQFRERFTAGESPIEKHDEFIRGMLDRERAIRERMLGWLDDEAEATRQRAEAMQEAADEVAALRQRQRQIEDLQQEIASREFDAATRQTLFTRATGRNAAFESRSLALPGNNDVRQGLAAVKAEQEKNTKATEETNRLIAALNDLLRQQSDVRLLNN